MADGSDKYETIDIAEFTGLYADKDESQEDFPSTASPYSKNFTMQNGILQSRKGRRRINDTAYDSRVTSLIPYVDRNNVEHLVFSVESDSEILETLDGTLKAESNAGLRKPLEAVLPISEPTGIVLADCIRDVKVRNGFLYVLRYFTTFFTAQVEKWTLDGEYVSKHSLSYTTGSYQTFEIDSQGYLYSFEPHDLDDDDAIVKYAFGGAEEARVVLDGVAGGSILYSLYIDGSTLYAGYNLDGGDCKLDSFDLDLGSQTNLYDPGDTNRIIDIDVTDDGSILIIRRDSAGTTRELRYYDGTVWTNTVDSFFVNLPSRLRVVEDKIYLSLVDDTKTGASQAAFYTYDHHWNYLERKGNVYLSTATKNKQWDVASTVRADLGSVEAGDIVFDVSDQYIYMADAITDASYGANVLYVIKKFRR